MVEIDLSESRVNEFDSGPLSAVIMGELKGVQKWLDRGASVHAVNKRGQSALMLCRNIETLGWLIGEGVAVNARDLNGRTALFEAAERENSHIVHVLLDHGAGVNVRDKWRRTALFEAATWHKPRNVRLLLNHGAKVDARTYGGTTPLMPGAWPWPDDTEAVETLSLLISHGADVNAVDRRGKTALIHLLEDEQHKEGYGEIVRLLLAHNVNTEIVDSEGNTALSLSVRRGLSDVVALLKQQAQ